jgi:ABC-type transporter Mla subunit MlaD
MRRLALIATLILGAGAAFAATATGEDEHTYFVELDNAFGIVSGSEVKVAGVNQGTVEDLFINSDKRAVIKVKLSGPLAALGEETICSSEPQSLIAEYFIDCIPRGAELDPAEGDDSERADDPDIPVEQTRQTVQPDLVQSALRQPFKTRLQMLINEFGTALAGNPENLNAAIRRGAPALESARKVTRILGEQNNTIRELNVNSDQIMAELADRREDVVRFIENAKTTAEASAERRDDLSANFRDLDDFLAELEPTMVELNNLALTQTPLLRNLRVAAPGLTRLSNNLPSFNEATARSLTSLGDAAVVGRRALRKGNDEIEQLKRSSRKASSVADHLSKFLRDIDDPKRAVAVDARAAEATGRDAPTGYTGLEGLLNYVYYQTGALTQYDQISHLLHFSIFEVENTPCSHYNAEQHVPSADDGETTDIRDAHRCVAWLGPNQPGINSGPDLPPYDSSVCPEGSTDTSICDPSGASSAANDDELRTRSAREATGVRGGDGSGGEASGGGNGGGGGGGSSGDSGGGDSGGGDADPGALGEALGLPELGKGLREIGKLGRGERSSGGGSGDAAPGPGATKDLLGYLFDD